MPTYETEPSFRRDFDRLTAQQQALFRVALAKFIDGLRSGHFRPSLRVKGVAGRPGVFEMTWAPDGRALFQYGDPVRAGEPHIIWLRIGSHDILD